MTTERPLSPHLQIYRPQITSMMSVLHRGTGIVLILALIVWAWWLLALAAGPDAYATFTSVAGSWVGALAMVGWSFALFYHLCAGIRHMLLDTGRYFTIPEIYRTGYITLGASVVLTLGFWHIVIL